MRLEFNILSDVYSIPDNQGNQRIIKRNVLTRMYINTENIKYVEEMINSKGAVVKNNCLIKLDDGELKRLKHNYENIKNIVDPLYEAKPIGFSPVKKKVKK